MHTNGGREGKSQHLNNPDEPLILFPVQTHEVNIKYLTISTLPNKT